MKDSNCSVSLELKADGNKNYIANRRFPYH
jgi:hypothetical protein